MSWAGQHAELSDPAARGKKAFSTHSLEGQSLVESCIVIAILCLLFMGIFQVSQLFMAQEILNFAAGRGARAKAVGFNDFMVYKTVRVGSIANAGLMTSPDIEGGPAEQRAIERSRIPLYLGAEWHGLLNPILDYEDWNDINYTCSEEDTPPMLRFRVFQEFPLRFAFHRAFYASDALDLTGEARLDNHYPLYLDTEFDGEP